MISEEYRKLNQELHESNPQYGSHGHDDLKKIKQLIKVYHCHSVLDYGCGKATLSKKLRGGFWGPKNLHIQNYDPAVPEFSKSPTPCDMVVCTDVLEHIEPEYLPEVLNHLKEMTKKVIFLSVATRPAKKTLADGRNAHLIQEKAEWWLSKLREKFEVLEFWGTDWDLYFVGQIFDK